MSYQSYQKVQQQSEDPRQTEYRLFADVTRSLREVKDRKPTDPGLIKALDWNRRMWSTFASDCGTKGNQLPDQLRASIISLSLWVSRHSSQVMRGTAKVDPLVKINRTVMDGLAQQAKLAGEENRSGTPTQSQQSINSHI